MVRKGEVAWLHKRDMPGAGHADPDDGSRSAQQQYPSSPPANPKKRKVQLLLRKLLVGACCQIGGLAWLLCRAFSAYSEEPACTCTIRMSCATQAVSVQEFTAFPVAVEIMPTEEHAMCLSP